MKHALYSMQNPLQLYVLNKDGATESKALSFLLQLYNFFANVFRSPPMLKKM